MNPPLRKPPRGTRIMNPLYRKTPTVETIEESSSSENDDFSETGGKVSNRRLLCIAFFTFMSFAIAQFIASIIAGSQSLLGDSVAMMVDSLNYLFNWYAERQKDSYASSLKGHGRKSLLFRKYTYQLELVPPLLSISTLLVVTVIVFKEAVRTLILDTKRDSSEQADPDVHLMFLFSLSNLLLDFVNVYCFVRADHAFGFATKLDQEDVRGENGENGRRTSATKTSVEYDECQQEDDNDDDDDIGKSDEIKSSEKIQSFEIESEGYSYEVHRHHHHHHEESSNLNMCSAYTHVFADTLRSIAVIFAALLATFVSSVTSEVADAAAAIFVSILIFFSLFPLLSGMKQTFMALRDIEKLLKEQPNDCNDDDDEEEEDGEEGDGTTAGNRPLSNLV